MYTRKQLQIAQCSRLRAKFFRNTVIYAFKLKWMVIHKPHHIFFIFFFCNRTGTENQHSARFHILCRLIKDRSLENDQFIFFLGCRAVFDLRFFAYYTITGLRALNRAIAATQKDNDRFLLRTDQWDADSLAGEIGGRWGQTYLTKAVSAKKQEDER